ncbi:MAG TPA: four helix bundle protein [Pyrinomonadaceae bacterium]|nr:four helix bundle protein [Pyrinomonadaceae bacterium]
MARTNFENLRVYQLSEQLSDLIWEIVDRWDWFTRTTTGRQIVDAADSVGANVAEGVGRYGTQDNKRFAYYARGSLYETKHWLRRAFKRKLLSEKDVERLKPIMDELSPRLNAYINSLKVVPRTTNDEPRTTN